MTDQKQPMQANGDGKSRRPDGVKDPANGRKGSESAGAAYPRPKRHKGSFGAHGGQSEIEYHGTGQLGDQKTGNNPNAVTGNQD